jgi:hypothetical protein
MTNLKHYFISDAKFLKLDIPVPYQEMLKEAQSLKHRFTAHRGGEDTHLGWKSLAIHGISEDKHENWSDYGYKSALDAAKDFVWTEASKDCPAIMQFLHNVFPCKRYGRVRLMLVEAGGWIGPHTDTKHRLLENINIPLSNPKGCMWNWSDGESLFMEPGVAYAMNISYEHSIVNNSDEDRYHLIVARHDSTDEWKKLVNQATEKSNVSGYYIEHEIVV